MTSMTPPPLEFTLVAAVTRNGAIGADGDLVWRSRDDLQRAKALTMGHTLVMGRKCFDAIGRPLPGRRTVVITRQRDWAHDGVTVVHDTGPHLDGALRRIAAATGDGAMFVFGGADVYRQLLDRCGALEITEVDVDRPGDAFFPEVDWDAWREAARDDRGEYAWVRYERR